MRSIFFILVLISSLLSKAQESTADYSTSDRRIQVSAAFGVWATKSAEGILPFKHDNLGKSAEGFSWELQALAYNKRKTLGLGGVFSHIMHSSQYNLAESCNLSAHTHLFYLAPQMSFPIKETAFTPLTGYINWGLGTVYYHNTGFLANQAYKVNSIGLGINGSIGLEYPFHNNYAIGIEGGVLFAHCGKLNHDIMEKSYHPEYKKLNSWIMRLCISFKYWL